MNKTPFQSFYWLFSIVFYLFIIISIILVGIEVSRWVRSEYSATYSFGGIKPNEIKQVESQKFNLTATDSKIRTPYLTPSEWKITFDAADPSIKIYMSFILFVHLGYILLILITLRSFVLSLKHNQVFTLGNIKRLQRLGLLLLLIEPLSWAGRYFYRLWMSQHMDVIFENVSFAYRLGYSLAAREFVWNWILAGLLVLIISEVFKQGLTLKEEVDLTV